MEDDMFRPPINRAMLQLDREFFKKTIPLRAARVFDNKNIFSVRNQLERSKDALRRPKLLNVLPDPDERLASQGKKCVLLRPEVQPRESTVQDKDAENEVVDWPHSPLVKSLADEGLIEVTPYELKLTYDYWSHREILSAILPEDDLEDIPGAFTHTGHVAHLNLRSDYLKYKHLIADVLMDKNPGVATVINKVQDVGETNEFRTFAYELLAGKDDMDVTVMEEDCVYRMDFSKVYWNSRLHTEHKRLVSRFKEGEAVCDVMAGIGPFAIPAGKRNVFVWANDLNPDSYFWLKEAIEKNKVWKYVRPFNEDGHAFIRNATKALLESDHSVAITRRPGPKLRPQFVKTLTEPKTFQHFVMNLPASALSFLPSFIGLYADQRDRLPAGTQMPQVHVHCFKPGEPADATIEICKDISDLLDHSMQIGKVEDGGVEVHDVRKVAPNKTMFCASFRLPEEVAFKSSTISKPDVFQKAHNELLDRIGAA